MKTNKDSIGTNNTNPQGSRSTGSRPSSGRASRPVGQTGTKGSTQRGYSQNSRYVQQKSGFRMRPLDIGIVVAALVVVGVIVWFGLNANNPTTVGVPNTTGNASAGASNTQGTTQIQNQAQAPSAPAKGTDAPGFTLPANDGKTYSLSQFKGKAVFVEFMAPWCPHCQADSVIFNQVYDAYKDKNVQMLDVSATPYGRNHETGDNSPITMDDLTWFASTYKVQYPMLFDPSTNVGNSYGIQYYPTVFIIDVNGKISDNPDSPYSVPQIGAALEKAGATH